MSVKWEGRRKGRRTDRREGEGEEKKYKNM